MFFGRMPSSQVVLSFHSSPNLDRFFLWMKIFHIISIAWRSSLDDVSLGKAPYDSIPQVLTRCSERSASSKDSDSWVEEALKTFLTNKSAVGPPVIYTRDVANARAAVSIDNLRCHNKVDVVCSKEKLDLIVIKVRKRECGIFR